MGISLLTYLSSLSAPVPGTILPRIADPVLVAADVNPPVETRITRSPFRVSPNKVCEHMGFSFR
jgi:hypothetical protein